MTITRNKNTGAIEVSDIINNQLISLRFYFCAEKEAVSRFKKYIKGM
jgi:hypothetical protein